MKPPAVPEADFAVHASVYGKLLIRLAPRHVTTLHCMPPPRPRRPTLRIHALAGGEAIPRCPAGLPLCCPCVPLRSAYLAWPSFPSSSLASLSCSIGTRELNRLLVTPHISQAYIAYSHVSLTG